MNVLTFKADDRHKKRLAKLQKKLKIDRSKVIRLAIDGLYNKIMDPEKTPGDLVVVDGASYRLIKQSSKNQEKMLALFNEMLGNMIALYSEAQETWKKSSKRFRSDLGEIKKMASKSIELLDEGSGENDAPRRRG